MCCQTKTVFDNRNDLFDKDVNSPKLVGIRSFKYFEEGDFGTYLRGAGVLLENPGTRQIPNSDLVVTFLNASLLTRFPSFNQLFATEGGIHGKYKQVFMELTNHYDYIGLSTDGVGSLKNWYLPQEERYEGLFEVLNFYEVLLRRLFEEPYSVGKRTYRAGEVFRMHPENISREKTYQIVTDAITSFKGKRFTNKVLERLTTETNSIFGAAHLRGLTNEEILERFVPPPGF